jgi:hypothetical protein
VLLATGPGSRRARHPAASGATACGYLRTAKTEQENDGRHGVWFNRGAIASQAFADQFQNASLTEAKYNDPNNKEVAWLSRGLLEACLKYIDDVPKGDALRVVAYEFTYQRVILSLKKALERGVDVKIVYHATPPNKKAIITAEFPEQNTAEFPEQNAKGETIRSRSTGKSSTLHCSMIPTRGATSISTRRVLTASGSKRAVRLRGRS